MVNGTDVPILRVIKLIGVITQLICSMVFKVQRMMTFKILLYLDIESHRRCDILTSSPYRGYFCEVLMINGLSMMLAAH